MAKTSEQKPSDFIKKTIGTILFVYYTYLQKYHCRPRDLEDLVDGLLYLDAYSFLEKKAYDDAKERAEAEAKRRSTRR